MKAIKVTTNNGRLVTLGEAEEIGDVWTIPYDLDALTLEQAQAVYKAMKNAPEGYLEALAGLVPLPDEQKWSSAIKEQTAVLCDALCGATNIPADALQALTLPQQRELLNGFECGVVLPLFNPAKLDPQERTEFEFEGVRYVNTAVERDPAGILVPNPDQTTEEFCESNDLLNIANNPIELMHLFVAVLCRPAGEAYDERKARERAEVFKRLPARIALDCFFSFASKARHTLINILRCLAEGAEQQKEGERARSPRGSRASTGRRRRATAVCRRPKSTSSKRGVLPTSSTSSQAE